MKLHIYIFRHGQTYFNKAHRFTGWKDSKLTAQGFTDARKVAAKLKSKRIDAAFSSHTSRSKDTLKEVLRFHPECRLIIVNDKIIERSYGKLSGLGHKSIAKLRGKAEYDRLIKTGKLKPLSGKEKAAKLAELGAEQLQIVRRSYDIPPPGGESVKMVEKRVNSFIKELIPFMKRNKYNVAISAHGNSMRPFRKHFEHLSNKQMMALENPWDDYFEYMIDA